MTLTSTSRIRHFLKSDFVIAAFLLAVFLGTNAYTFAWDDQHVEIPLLKSLIDPALYPGDYYVTSLKKNFTSFLYPILAKLITVGQIPAVYFWLYLLSRYFFFYWMYKLWLFISKEKGAAFACVLTVILLGRVEEFLYRSFSHQEFALAFIMAGFYFFYKERFFLAAALLGFAANFHALYSLFPMLYMLFFLFKEHKKFGWPAFFKLGLIFAGLTSPFLIWTLSKPSAISSPANLPIDWYSLYKIACPHNFLFLEIPLETMKQNLQSFIAATNSYFLLLFLFILNICFHHAFRKDTKAQAVVLTATGLLLISFVFTYLVPVQFIIDLNLIRNAQYLLFILGGSTTLLVIKILREKNMLLGVLTLLAFTLIRFGDTVGAMAVLTMVGLAGYAGIDKTNQLLPRTPWHFVLISFTAIAAYFLVQFFLSQKFSPAAILTLQVIAGLLSLGYVLSFFFKSPPWRSLLKNTLIFIPYFLLIINYGYYHYRHIQTKKSGEGFWQLQRNWIDLQHYVRNNTPKNALFLIPHDMEMGGFRIFSERPIVMEYRDCGIVGFDYPAAVEWYRRLKEIEPYQIFITKGPIEPVIKKAITDYKVNYIVFMRYVNPSNSSIMEEVYHNEAFALFKVKVNPVQ